MHIGKIDDAWVRDTGLLGSLVLLVLGGTIHTIFLWGAGFILLVLMSAPKLLWPIAWGWRALTLVLGFVMNRVFFGVVFLGIITPVGLIKRIFDRDPLCLSFAIAKSRTSAFVTRSGRVSARDFDRPY